MILTRTIKALTTLIILFHFMGVTQFVSSYSKNTASFIGMLSQTEEETKKEKDTKEEDSEYEDLKQAYSFEEAGHVLTQYSLGCIRASEEVEHQHIGSLFAPPPNFIA